MFGKEEYMGTQLSPLETITAALQERQDSDTNSVIGEEVTVEDVQLWAEEPPRSAD